MSDWPTVVMQPPVISLADYRSGSTGGVLAAFLQGSGVWPAANRAIYMPFEVQDVCVAQQIGFAVAVQSGNLDVGIYDVAGNRIVSKGSTAVGAAGIQAVDITDTTLGPGAYFLAMSVDNITASFSRVSSATTLVLESIGVQQQALGSVTLVDPATFANPASAYVPVMFVSTMKSTI